MSPKTPEQQISDAARSAADIAFSSARVASRLAGTGAGLWWRQVRQVERAALQALGDRMALATPEREAPAQLPQASAAETMADLLARAVQQTTHDGREELFRSIAEQLLPDEARIVAALAGDREAALVHVEGWVPGGRERRTLENVTLLGARASLTVPDMARGYVSKLLGLGVLEIGPESDRFAKDYEILGADSAVRAALSQAGINKVPGRTVRRTLRLSALGEDFWATCGP